ncbi:MAG: hypothetical protein JXQ75_07275 [Phycisphaerae bacterium]|nr:hypothetical protein [Phycisphaerae bacterium]
MVGQYDRIVQPGETGKIALKVRTARLTGRLSKTITVHTNIPGDGGDVRVKLTGEAWQPVQVTPRAASFGRFSMEQARKGAVRKLTVENNVEDMASITDVQSTNPAFEAEVAVVEPGRKFELVVSILPEAAEHLKQGNNNGKITMSTGIEETPTLEVTVSAYVTADVDVTPNRLTLASGRSTDLMRQFTVRNYSKEPVTISDLSVSSPELKIALQETTPGVNYRITLEIPASYEVHEGGDTITFKTDNPSVPDVTIPITERSVVRRTVSPSKRVTAPVGPQEGARPAAANQASPGANQATPGTTEEKQQRFQAAPVKARLKPAANDTAEAAKQAQPAGAKTPDK